MSDEYVEGDSNSEPADAPGVVPTEDTGRPAAVIDSVAAHDAPQQRIGAHRNAARTQAARKAFAEAVLAAKKNPPPVSEDLEDPEDVALAPAEKPAVAAPEAKKPMAEVAPAPAEAKPPEPVVPPAPSLDPEVRKLKEQLAAEQREFQAKVAEWEKGKKTEPPPPDALSLEDYIDSAPRAYRNWLESMRGEKFATEDEFKGEVADFITQLSSDVLGVPLPEATKTKLEAALARKAVRTHKTILSRKEAALAAKLEKERAEQHEKAEAARVEEEWGKAASAISEQFAPRANAEGKPEASAASKSYPWLGAEDDPGKIVVDVIRAAYAKDQTSLSWQEASKRANDYLAEQAKRYYEKRSSLLKPAEAAPPPAAKPKPAAPVATPPTPPPAPRADAESKKWSRERHMESTKAAFRQMLTQKPAPAGE